MSILKTIVPKPDRILPSGPRRHAPEDSKQRGLMIGSLCLLLLALSIVLWRDRDFWFSDDSEADADQSTETSPVVSSTPVPRSAPIAKAAPAPKHHHKARSAQFNTEVAATADDPEPPGPIITRTILPPLEVEVVAGDSHRVIRPGNNSLRVELQPDAQPQPAPEETSPANTQTAASVTNNAAERVQMSPDASAVVTRTVKPSYPLLARQMKVQGSVILQALIGRDGVIQNLRVVSGPHILASAAEDAVRQWHFKPHLEGQEAVETQAKITVNFTISTN
ncbi:MAG TPA: TonB family protein [Candidatus Aquilonibacter sp.]|jgi:TonB family protein|nr:TonB family protein [Candidatus Aquilonibacter sp.]